MRPLNHQLGAQSDPRIGADTLGLDGMRVGFIRNSQEVVGRFPRINRTCGANYLLGKTWRLSQPSK